MVNAQEWLDQNYPKEKRKQITYLDISKKELEGTLDLTDFINLTGLNCYNNKLTKLILSSNNNLQALTCWGNLLTDLDFLSSLNKEKITFLSLRDNNFPEQDLSCFTEFTKLEWLYLGTVDQERIKQGIYNRWTGSLEPLKNLSQLKVLTISNTGLNSGIEYLPSSIKNIYFSSKERPESKVKEIAEQLEWINKGFTWQQAKEWSDNGFTLQDSYFCAWLRDIKKTSPEQVSDNNKLELRNEFLVSLVSITQQQQIQLQWQHTQYQQQILKERQLLLDQLPN